MILTETPRRKLVTKLVNWGHWFALTNIIIAIIIASVYVFTSPMPGTLIGTLYLFANWFSHMAFLTFMGFVILVLPLCYLVPQAKVVKAISSVLAASGLALLAFDSLLYNRYGLHLSVSSAELIRTEAQTVMAEFGWQQWGFLLMLFLVWLSFQLIVANALWKRIERFQRYKLAMPIGSFFVMCFMGSHAVHVWADANLYQPIVKQDDMFPLSYPATAKTLMSKYGLLDMQNYQQRKELQFSRDIESVEYPAAPVYCSVERDRRVAVLLQTGEAQLPSLEALGLRTLEDHYSISASAESAAVTALFGLPELYHESLQQTAPLMLELPQKLGVPVSLYSDVVIKHAGISQYTQTWDAFNEALANPQGNLAIGVVSDAQLAELIEGGNLMGHDLIVASLQSNLPHYQAEFATNMLLEKGLSSLEDLAPTVLQRLGCQADAADYSLGQNLAQPRRSWIVGTQADKVLVMHNGQRIEVTGNGNYKIYQRKSDEESDKPLNTGLLSQAMKHLSRFNR